MRHYALRFPVGRHQGAYSLTGRRCLVRTFATAAERDAYVEDQPPKNSVLFDGERQAVPSSTLLTDAGRTVPISEAVPGL